MSDTRTVAVKLRADTTSYTSSMKKASQSTEQFDKAQEKAQRNSQRWKAIGLASQAGGVALAAGLLAATKAASDQEQALGSLNAVFKANGVQMAANAKAATAIGLSTTQYSQAAAKLGAQLTNLGVDQASLGGATDDLIKKAADLAAQFGGTTQDAVDALGAAFRGEADPAERYGLALNMTAVNAEMAATGTDKATAMMSLLNKQMTKTGTIGAWNREMDTAAAKTQMARAEFDNAAADLGESLLPAMAAAEGAASKLLSTFNNMSDGAKQATTYVAAVGAAALVAGPKIIEMSIAVNKLANSGVALAGLARSAAMLGGAVVAAEGFIAAIGGITSKAGELTGLPDVFNAIRDAIIGLTPGLGPGLWLRDTMDQLGLAGLGWNKLTGQTSEASGALRESSIAAFRAAVAAKQSGDASRDDADAKTEQAEAAKAATEQYNKYIEAVSRALGLLSAKDAMIGQEQRLAEAVKKNGNALKGQTAAAAANRAAIAAEVTNITELVQAKYEETGSLRVANRVRKEQIANLLRSAEAAGMDRQQTRALLKQLDLLKPIRTSVTVDGLGPATAQAQALARALGKIVQNSGLGNFGIGAPGRAAGGYITGPGSATSDSIPANLSNGEYVLRASAVKRIGVDELDRMNYARGGRVRGGGGRGRAHGGGRGRAHGGGRGRAHGGGRGGSGPGRPHAGGGGDRDPGMGFGKAMRAVDKWRDKVAESKQKLADLKKEAADYADSISQNILQSAGGGLFDMFKKSDMAANAEKLASAQDRVAAASRRLYDAQVKVNTADPEQRAEALRELADAQRELGEATGEQAQAEAAAAASAPTPQNIMGRMRARAEAIENYASKVKALMGRGLSIDLIKELAGSDMMEAGPVLDALLAMPADALAELGSLDKRAKDAAQSVGNAVSGAAFAGQIGQAEVELGVNQDGLEDALKDADKTLTKDWRKVIANAGLSAKEHASLLQSLRNNDGKLTRYWRNKLAMAGLGAEERKELMDAITGGDTTMGREWRDKLQKTGLSAEEKDELAAELANAKNPDRALRKYWIDELQNTGLSAVESSDLYKEITNTKNPSRSLYKEWVGQLMATGLTAKEAKEMIGDIQTTHGVVDTNWTNQPNKKIGLGARDGGIGGDVDTHGYGNTKLVGWQGDKKHIGLGAANRGVGEDVGTEGYGNPKLGEWERDNRKTGLGAKNKSVGEDVGTEGYGNQRLKEWSNDTIKVGLGAKAAVQSVRQAIYDVALEAWRVAKANWHPPLKVPKKPNPSDYGLAMGGYVKGPGSASSDSIPAMLSNGEFVIRAAAVSKYGADLMHAINAGRFASGGPVGYRTTTAAPGGMNGGSAVVTSVPVIVQIDGREIAKSQLKIERQSGGTITVGG